MKILTTGSNGMLGQDMCPILEDMGAYVIETQRNTMDITNPEEVKRVITDSMPNMIIHMAAYTDVEKAETEREIAEQVNIHGTKNIVKVCSELGITLVYISTDYVFDGKKETPYEPEDTVNPINHYGWTKLQGETSVKTCPKYYIARTSWLYGHHGKNFVTRMLELSKNPEIKIVDDEIGCPTWTMDLAEAIIKLFNMPYGTYHICGTGAVSRYDFAKEIFSQFGIKTNIIPCSSTEFLTKAKRPAYSVMNNHGFCRNWHEALKDYVMLSELN